MAASSSDSSTTQKVPFKTIPFYVVETKTTKANHCWSSSQLQVRSYIKFYAKTSSKSVLAIEENNTKQHEKLLSRPSNTDRWQNPMEKTEEQI